MHNIWLFGDKYENIGYLHPRHFSNFVKEVQALSNDSIYGQEEVEIKPVPFEEIKLLRDEIDLLLKSRLQ